MGGAMSTEKVRGARSSSIAQAVEGARAEIAQLAIQKAAADKRIDQLRSFIKSCAAIEGTPRPRTPTYAEHAMRILAGSDHPMTAGQLVDALGAAGTPVRGHTRRHRVTTLAISLRRSDGVRKTAEGYVLAASTKRASGHGS